MNKYKKSKESVRSQILTRLNPYHNKLGISIHSISNKTSQNDILDSNDLEVLSIKLSFSKRILITTKCIFLIQKDQNIRINIEDLKSLDYIEYSEYGKAVGLRKKLLKYVISLRIGKYQFLR